MNRFEDAILRQAQDGMDIVAQDGTGWHNRQQMMVLGRGKALRIGFNCKFVHAPRQTGVERFARNLLASLTRAGEEHEFVLFGSGRGADLELGGGRLQFVGWCGWRSAAMRHAWEQAALPLLARRSGVDILINPTNSAPLACDRNVVVIHDLSFLDHPEWSSRAFRLMYRTLVPRAARRARAVVTVSEFSRRRIIELLGLPPERVHVVYQGADPAFRPRETAEVERVEGKYQICRPYVLFVGSIAPRKNLARAVEAFRIARASLATAHTMLVVGVSGPQFGKTEAPSDLDGSVRALGYVHDADLPALYAGAEALIYPSLYEGFGLPPLEAMACGTPVVTSDRASLPEVVGDAAITVDPKDTQAIAVAIKALLTDRGLCEDLGRRGLERARLFSWEGAARSMLEICGRALSHP